MSSISYVTIHYQHRNVDDLHRTTSNFRLAFDRPTDLATMRTFVCRACRRRRRQRQHAALIARSSLARCRRGSIHLSLTRRPPEGTFSAFPRW